MDNPKVSVLIPMYNRKHYIAQCVDSVLAQTFQDFEIIIRDNCSSDGSYEFVAEKYAAQISAGKIKLYRNAENLGEFGNTNALVNDAAGKYIAILHSDDLYLPHALQHLYEVAEKTNADVVHQSFFLVSPENGIINDLKDCKIVPAEKNTFDKIKIISDAPADRFDEWLNYGTHTDSQYNLFRRDFVLENRFFADGYDHRYIALWWIMLAKILVKTPIICYVWRESPDSGTNANFPSERLEKFISDEIQMARDMDRRFAQIDFFKDNEYFQYMAKAHIIAILDNFNLVRRKIYVNGITQELYHAAKNVFKEKFGDDYFYPMFLFNLINTAYFKQRVDIIKLNNPPPI